MSGLVYFTNTAGPEQFCWVFFYQHHADYDTMIRRQVFSLKRQASEQNQALKCVSGDDLSLTEYDNVSSASVSRGPRKTSAS